MMKEGRKEAEKLRQDLIREKEAAKGKIYNIPPVAAPLLRPMTFFRGGGQMDTR